jgi:two-component system chemotaxis response regulator CheY
MSKVIVLADDSKTLLMAMKAPLVEAGYRVLEAEDGLIALDIIKKTPVDLLITDFNMPNMNGMELSKAVRENEVTKFLPILMLTTESGEDLKAQAKLIGLTAWLTKPFMPTKLLNVVQKVLK